MAKHDRRKTSGQPPQFATRHDSGAAAGPRRGQRCPEKRSMACASRPGCSCHFHRRLRLPFEPPPSAVINNPARDRSPPPPSQRFHRERRGVLIDDAAHPAGVACQVIHAVRNRFAEGFVQKVVGPEPALDDRADATPGFGATQEWRAWPRRQPPTAQKTAETPCSPQPAQGFRTSEIPSFGHMDRMGESLIGQRYLALGREM